MSAERIRAMTEELRKQSQRANTYKRELVKTAEELNMLKDWLIQKGKDPVAIIDEMKAGADVSAAAVAEGASSEAEPPAPEAGADPAEPAEE